MSDWLANFGGGQYISALLWTLAALVLLAVVLALVKRSRGAGSGTFISGGRNRAPRLAVVDATAVDSQRRLVLVRRDDVEHLILIGGPTDVVIEPAIGRSAQRPLAAPVESPARPARPAARPAPPVPQPAGRRSGAAGTARPQAPEPRVAEPAAAAGFAASHAGRQANAGPAADTPAHDLSRDGSRQAEPAPRPSWQPAPEARPEPSEPTREGHEQRPQPAQHAALAAERETALLEEIDLSIDEMDHRPVRQEPPQQPDEMSIEDEMSRLLDDLADDRRKDS